MCVYSAVMDHYTPRFDEFTFTKWPPTAPDPQAEAIQELRALIAEFRQAVEAARTVDRLTKQPDCEDPEKAKLEQRVAKLEKELAGLKKRKRQ